MSELADRLTQVGPGMQEFLDIGLPDRSDGWVYKDLPKLPMKLFEEFEGVVGAENISWLSKATYERPDGLLARGQMFMSPIGKARLEAYLKEHARAN